MPGVTENIVSDKIVIEEEASLDSTLIQRSLRFLVGLFLPVLATLPAFHIRELLYKWVQASIQRLHPKDAARFLMGLDNALYPLHGQAAIDYEGGLHSKHRLTNYHNFFVDRISENEYVLDIGCGNGVVAYDIAANSRANVWGVDLNKESIQIGKERYQHDRLRLSVGDALDLDFDSRFDVVILSNVLEHLPDRSVFLKKAKERTKADRFLIRVPLYERDWRVPFKQELGLEWRLDPTHETEYTLESFRDEMEDAGLIITHLQVRWGEIWSELSTHAS